MGSVAAVRTLDCRIEGGSGHFGRVLKFVSEQALGLEEHVGSLLDKVCYTLCTEVSSAVA